MISPIERSVDKFTDMKNYIINVFKECVKSVLPRNIIKNTLKFDSRTLQVNNDKFFISKDVYVVGFGKAVLDMALEVEKLLKGSLTKAVVSVPFGANQGLNNSKICVLEAAKNNIPDECAVENTNCIKNLITKLNDEDVLIVLVSGGGSALLCSPTVPLSDKILTINLLSSNGASIVQLNSVRKVLSHVKGGKLVDLVNKSTIISLILSDVIGDPLSVIASGPTVPNNDPSDLPINIIKQFNLIDKIPSTVLNVLKYNTSYKSTDAKSVHNYIIGNNMTALQTGVECTKNDYIPILLTKSLQGNITLVSEFYCNLVLFVCDMFMNRTRRNETLKEKLVSNINIIDKEIDIDLLINKIIEASFKQSGLCIFSGGEPTVKVQGCGLGGRNQELALRTSINIAENYDCLKQFDIMFFSGGTDGIDGPTDACGAFGYLELVKIAQSQGLNPSEFIKNNDSYRFYSLLNNGADLLKIGHTGTNVMDIEFDLMADERKESQDQASTKTDEYAGWGFDLFPERRGSPTMTIKNILLQGRGNENVERLKCEKKVSSCLSKSPLVKIMMGALKRSGCEVSPSRHIACEYCDTRVHGGYDPIMNQIVICQNTAVSKGTIQGVLTHELIHMFDNCTRKLDFKNIEHLACTEIRAANLTHCGLVSSLLEGHSSIFNFRKKHQDCVKHKAVVSILAVRNVTYDQAKEAVEKVFDRCYADLEPIGRRIKGKTIDFELAYAEAFLMGYD